jgi:hypothetical protein
MSSTNANRELDPFFLRLKELIEASSPFSSEGIWLLAGM